MRGGFYDAVVLRAETPGSQRSALRERHLRQLAREFSRSYSRRCFPAFRCVDPWESGPVACGRGPASATSSCIAAGPMSGYVLSRHALCSTAGCLRATVADAETQCTCRRPDTHGHSAIRATAARQCRRQVSSPEVSKKSGSFRMLGHQLRSGCTPRIQDHTQCTTALCTALITPSSGVHSALSAQQILRT